MNFHMIDIYTYKIDSVPELIKVILIPEVDREKVISFIMCSFYFNVSIGTFSETNYRLHEQASHILEKRNH